MYDANEVFNKPDNCIYAILADTDELLFTIEEHWNNEGYIASNSMGYGTWRCNTIDECIDKIENAYNDTVIDKSKRINQ